MCANSGLAMPAGGAQRRPSHWILWIGGGAIAFLILMVVHLKMVANSEAAEEASRKAARRTELDIESSISTPDGLRARCGAPQKIVRGVSEADARDLDASRLTQAVTLIYPGPGTEMHVIYPNDGPPVFREHFRREHFGEKIYGYTPFKGLVEMGCVKPWTEP